MPVPQSAAPVHDDTPGFFRHPPIGIGLFLEIVIFATIAAVLLNVRFWRLSVRLG
jgi:hypothetical protein